MGTPPPSRAPPPNFWVLRDHFGWGFTGSCRPAQADSSPPAPAPVYSVPNLSQLGAGARGLSESLRGPLDLGVEGVVGETSVTLGTGELGVSEGRPRSPAGRTMVLPVLPEPPSARSRPLPAAAVTPRSGASWLLVPRLHCYLLAFLLSLGCPHPLPFLPHNLPGSGPLCLSSTSILLGYRGLPPIPSLPSKTNKQIHTPTGPRMASSSLQMTGSQLSSSPAVCMCKQ